MREKCEELITYLELTPMDCCVGVIDEHLPGNESFVVYLEDKTWIKRKEKDFPTIFFDRPVIYRYLGKCQALKSAKYR